MKKLIFLTTILIQTSVISVVLLLSCLNVLSQVITYPASPGYAISSDFIMTVNGSKVPVQKLGPDILTDQKLLENRKGILRDETDSVNISNFSCAGKLTIVITARENIDSFLIRPKSKGIIGHKKGKTLTFTMSGPGKAQIEVNKLTHLAVFANPLEVNPPKKVDSKVVYYGPGIHKPGEIKLQSNQTIYIAGGAVVVANIRGSNLQNVKIIGRGILQGNVKISGTTNLLVDGIIVNSTGRGWTNTLTDCHHSAYHNVKVFGYMVPWSTDGINPWAAHISR